MIELNHPAPRHRPIPNSPSSPFCPSLPLPGATQQPNNPNPKTPNIKPQHSNPKQEPNMPPSSYPPDQGPGPTGPTSSFYPYSPPDPSYDAGASRNKHVHFPDSFSPSEFSIRIKLGPRDHPSSVIKISIEFEPGRFPRVRVRTKGAGGEESSSRRRRRRRY
jgi:hypothetical protein